MEGHQVVCLIGQDCNQEANNNSSNNHNNKELIRLMVYAFLNSSLILIIKMDSQGFLWEEIRILIIIQHQVQTFNKEIKPNNRSNKIDKHHPSNNKVHFLTITNKESREWLHKDRDNPFTRNTLQTNNLQMDNNNSRSSKEAHVQDPQL
jgi:hypothetical protein